MTMTMPSQTDAEERAALVEAVRDFADARLAPFANQRDADKELSLIHISDPRD